MASGWPHLPRVRRLIIDVVSDVICPWCLIGSRRLDQALETLPDVHAEVTYHPFLLDSSTPVEGVDLRERLAKKYGIPPERMFARVEAAARESGIPLDFAKITKVASTVGSHTLLRHAVAKGTQRALVRGLYEAYFFEGKNIGDKGELAAIAAEHGFTRDEALALLDDAEELRATLGEAETTARQGITGVPFFIFDQKLALSGAQPVSVMQQAISQALDEEPAAAG